MIAPPLHQLNPGDKLSMTFHKNPKPSWLESAGHPAGAAPAAPAASPGMMPGPSSSLVPQAPGMREMLMHALQQRLAGAGVVR